MSIPSLGSAFVSGVVAANALPHLFAASAGVRHRTLLGDRDSPSANALWSTLNVAGAAGLVAATLRCAGRHERVAFKAGVVAFSGWALLSEFVTHLND